MDEPGNRGFSGAAKAARGQTLQSAKALILMGDWCATATPTFENQVCDEFDADSDSGRERRKRPEKVNARWMRYGGVGR